MNRHRSGGLFVGGTVLIGLLLIGGAQVAAHQRHPNGKLQLAWRTEHISAVTAIDMDAPHEWGGTVPLDRRRQS